MQHIYILAEPVSLAAGLMSFVILIGLHDGSSGPIKLHTPPYKIAARVLDACTCNFLEGIGTISPKDNPNLVLIGEDVISGGVTYVFTPAFSGGY